MSDSRPAGWGALHVAPPGGTLDLCAECLARFVKAIEKVLGRALES